MRRSDNFPYLILGIIGVIGIVGTIGIIVLSQQMKTQPVVMGISLKDIDAVEKRLK